MEMAEVLEKELRIEAETKAGFLERFFIPNKGEQESTFANRTGVGLCLSVSRVCQPRCRVGGGEKCAARRGSARRNGEVYGVSLARVHSSSVLLFPAGKSESVSGYRLSRSS